MKIVSGSQRRHMPVRQEHCQASGRNDRSLISKPEKKHDYHGSVMESDLFFLSYGPQVIQTWCLFIGKPLV